MRKGRGEKAQAMSGAIRGGGLVQGVEGVQGRLKEGGVDLYGSNLDGPLY